MKIAAPWPDVTEEYVSVEMRDEESITVRVYMAQENAQGPALVMLHRETMSPGIYSRELLQVL